MKVPPWFGLGWTRSPVSMSALAVRPHRSVFALLRASQGTHGSPALSLQGRHAVSAGNWESSGHDVARVSIYGGWPRANQLSATAWHAHDDRRPPRIRHHDSQLC